MGSFIPSKRILKKNEFKNIIIWCFSPRWDPIIDNLRYKSLIFHCVDALNTYDKSSKFKCQFDRILKKRLSYYSW